MPSIATKQPLGTLRYRLTGIILGLAVIWMIAKSVQVLYSNTLSLRIARELAHSQSILFSHSAVPEPECDGKYFALYSIENTPPSTARLAGLAALACGDLKRGYELTWIALNQCCGARGCLSTCWLGNLQIAWVYFLSGQRAVAVDYLREAQAASYLVNLSYTHSRLGDPKWGEVLARLAVDVDPKAKWTKPSFVTITSYAALGEALASQARWEDALSAYELAFAHTTAPEVYSSAAQIAGYKLGNWKRADLILREAVARWPDSLWSNLHLADALVRQGKGHEARGIAERMYVMYPNKWGPSLYLGFILFQQGEYDRAEILIQDSLKFNSNEQTGLAYLGLLAEKRGDLVSAIVFYEQAYAVDPANCWVSGLLLDALRKASQTGKANSISIQRSEYCIQK